MHHGWPSFRPEEIVSENVIIHDDGRMESRCLTHIGHNLPDGGTDRYCIDLVCMTGEPLSTYDERAKILTLMDESAIDNDEFNAATYTSSAEECSDKYSKFPTKFVIGAASIVVVALIYFFLLSKKRRRTESQRSLTLS